MSSTGSGLCYGLLQNWYWAILRKNLKKHQPEEYKDLLAGLDPSSTRTFYLPGEHQFINAKQYKAPWFSVVSCEGLQWQRILKFSQMPSSVVGKRPPAAGLGGDFANHYTTLPPNSYGCIIKWVQCCYCIFHVSFCTP